MVMFFLMLHPNPIGCVANHATWWTVSAYLPFPSVLAVLGCPYSGLAAPDRVPGLPAKINRDRAIIGALVGEIMILGR